MTAPILSGTCRICGCTDLSPCMLFADGSFGNDEPGIPYRCGWMDAGHTLCSNSKCIAAIPLDELMEICAMQSIAAAAGGKS
jgi:hypothetical protein